MTTYKSDMDTDKMSFTKREQIADLNPDALFADGFDDALIGYCADSFVAVYDYLNCVDILHKEMTPQEAHEYMEFNVVSAFVGKNTPIFIHSVI